MNRRALAIYSIVAFVMVFLIGLTAVYKHQIDYGRARPFLLKQSSQATLASPTHAMWEVVRQVNQDRATKDLRKITGEEPICASSGCYTVANRLTGSKGLHEAMDYIYENLVGLGYSVESRDWSRSAGSDRNLVARKSGVFSPTEEIYLVAHVDGVKTGTEERFPSADDNASGAVGILEVARALSTFSFSRTVVLLFTTGEEQGGLGARSYLDQLSIGEVRSIKYAIDVDMVGYDPNGDGVMELWSGDHLPSLSMAQTVSGTISALQLGLTPVSVVGCT